VPAPALRAKARVGALPTEGSADGVGGAKIKLSLILGATDGSVKRRGLRCPRDGVRARTARDGKTLTKIHDREQVIDAAAKVFAAKGFEAARLEEIAAELGVLKGSLYYHAASKAELLFLVTRRRMLTIIEHTQAIAVSEAPPAEKLATAVRAHLQHLDQHHPESSLWFMQPSRSAKSADRQAEIGALHREYEVVLRGIVQDGIGSGDLRRDLDATVATLGVLGMCNWLPRWYDRDGRLAIDGIGDTFIGMVLDGLRSV